MSKVFFEQSFYVRRNLRSCTTDQRSLLSTSCRLKQFPQKWKNIKANYILVENQQNFPFLDFSETKLW